MRACVRLKFLIEQLHAKELFVQRKQHVVCIARRSLMAEANVQPEMAELAAVPPPPLTVLKSLRRRNDLWKEDFNSMRLGMPVSVSKHPATIEIALTGSRSVGMAYPQSDMEFAIVVKNNTDEATKLSLAASVAYYMKPWSHSVNRFQTKAGLILVVAKFTDMGMWKLECTIREEAQHAKIQDNMVTHVAEMAPEEAVRYILDMQRMFINGDEAGMAVAKQWMHVL